MADNPRAFPSTITAFQNGMTLRDYFAGQAIAGICAADFPISDDQDECLSVASSLAYLIADAMLKAREAKQ